MGVAHLTKGIRIVNAVRSLSAIWQGMNVKKHTKAAEALLDKYKRQPQKLDKTVAIYWLMEAVLFLLVRYIDGE